MIAALVAVSAIAAAVADAGPSVPSKNHSTMLEAGPEHVRLTEMCGTWDVEMMFWFRPGGPGYDQGHVNDPVTLFHGLFVEEKIDGALTGAPFTTLASTGFNTATHQYEAPGNASTNTIRIAETGSYDEKTRQFELKAEYLFAGDTWH